MKQPKVKTGFIPAAQGFFSDRLAGRMRGGFVRVLGQVGVQVIVASTRDTKIGCVETLEEAL